jgi:hypothetical protein
VTIGFEVPRRHVLRPTFFIEMVPMGFAVGEVKGMCSSRKRQGAMAKKHCYKKFLMNLFWERGDEDKIRQKNGQT